MTPEEIAADIQERVIAFLEARGGYVASASERELIALLRTHGDARAAQERERCEAAATARAVGWGEVLDTLQKEQPGTLRIEHVGPFSRWLEACDIAALINKPDQPVGQT